MLFNSYIFIFCFLPLAVILYFTMNFLRKERLGKAFLILMSLWFYAYFHLSYLPILVLSIGINFGISKLLLKLKDKETLRRYVLILGILCNIGAIFYYKYYGFFMENIHYLFADAHTVRNILMPLGISFFTFQQISYLVDSFRGETKDHGFLDYALFVSFFPQLVAGPIVTHEEMIPQFQDMHRKKPDQYYLARGLYWFGIGLAKKVLLADTLGKGVEWGYAHPGELSALAVWTVSFLYMFQLYFDFSGYCDMACGIASMFHLDLPINFNSPYKAVSIVDFWKRWHISLTRFLRKYVYIPLGGSRKGKKRTLLNVMIVFFVSGIWHGANWTFILWGVIHGIMNVLNRIFEKVWNRVPRFFEWLATFLFVDLAWIIFRAPSLADCKVLFRTLLQGKGGGIPAGLSGCFDVIEFTYLEDHVRILKDMILQIPSLHIWILLGIAFVITILGRNCYEKQFAPSPGKAVCCIVMIVWSVMSLTGVSSFLYFNF